jgi:hypothetical protein
MNAYLQNEGFTENSRLQLAYDFIQRTGSHVFLTGKAGTGKTTFLKRLQESTSKRMIVTAPTGVAAINAGGVTIHSFFQLPFGPQVISESAAATDAPKRPDINKFSKEKIRIIQKMDLLVIDEISMVRADLLDAIDRVLRRYKKRHLPFGGVQLLMIGDVRQLAPVVTESDWSLLKGQYESPYFFSSKVLKQASYVTIELLHIFRQRDEKFIQVLNQVRDNSLDHRGLELLKSRYFPEFEPDAQDGYITLTTHNQQANVINERELSRLQDESVFYLAEISGVFPEYSYPTEVLLELKTGAQVMFARNDISREKRFYNGKIGTVVSLDDDIVTVECAGGERIETEAVEWHNYTYTIDPETEEIQETLLGTFKQIPLKLAWAITIHKSQGLTFDKVVIDANAAFAHGQVYVALSRCTSLEGLVLRSLIDARRLFVDTPVKEFLQEAELHPPDQNRLETAERAYKHHLLQELFDFLPIRHRLDQCSKWIRDNDSVLGGKTVVTIRMLTEVYRSDIQDVSRKFARQLERINRMNPQLDTNRELEERIMKGGAYFFSSLLQWRSRFVEELVLSSGNKALRKSLTEALDRLDEELEQKLTFLESVRNNFNWKMLTEPVKSTYVRELTALNGIVKLP